MKSNKNQWRSMKINENQWKSIRINKNLWKSMKINRNLWKSMKINKSPWNPWACMGYICFEKKNSYMLYSKEINTSHICPPKRNKLFQQRKWKSGFSGKHWLWPVKRKSKSWFRWKREMIPRWLRTFCPRRSAINPW